jgi:hypothetical protein
MVQLRLLALLCRVACQVSSHGGNIMPEPILKRFLDFLIPNDPKRLRQGRNLINFFFVVCTAYLVYKDYPRSSASLAFACAVMLMASLAIGHRLDMIDLLRRIEALERAKKEIEGTEHR